MHGQATHQAVGGCQVFSRVPFRYGTQFSTYKLGFSLSGERPSHRFNQGARYIMKSLSPDLSTPLSEEELFELDEALLNRFDEDSEPLPGDEGIIDVTELDGLLTAVVSSPVMIMPSRWFPAVWGDYPPVFETTAEVERVTTLMIRHMNDIATTLMSYPEEFEPLFSYREVDNQEFTIVDEWCEGYMRGIKLALGLGATLDDATEELLIPIRAFTEAAAWPGHDLPEVAETERLQQSIAPNVRALHAYWLERRIEPDPLISGPYHRDSPRVGRNDPCPCGSGKKFKKCCLH